MTGTVFKETFRSGRAAWRYQADCGVDKDGKRQRITKGGFKRERDAQDELNRLLVELQDGSLVKPTPQTFQDFLEEWFSEHAKRHCTPKTVERYRQIADSYIIPKLGSVPLKDITALALERLYNSLRDSGGKNGRRLSAKTVRHVASLVHVALQTAIRWKLLNYNPADGCVPPKVERKEARALDVDELQAFVQSTTGEYLYPFLLLAAATGARRGELLALTRADVNLIEGIVEITKSLEQTKVGLRIKPPKNGKPRRLKISRSAVEALAMHLQQQDETRKMFGSDYRADPDLIFCTPEGDYLNPDSVTAKVCVYARRAGLKAVSLHTLRHTHASQLLAAGVSLATVSKRLGHSSVNVTAQIYTHALSRDEVTAADVWETDIWNARKSEEECSADADGTAWHGMGASEKNKPLGIN